MAESGKVTPPDHDDTRYDTFDVAPSRGRKRNGPKKRSTLLTVCPFILGKRILLLAISAYSCCARITSWELEIHIACEAVS